MAEKTNNDPLDEIVSINLKVPERERRAFKVWCAERGITQVDAFRKGIELLRAQDAQEEDT
jgi:hypothetical protein